MKQYVLVLAGALAAANLEAAPAISSGGVSNAASYAYAGLPNAAIAQGSLFAVFGSAMGPATLQSGSYPLPTSLSGTSISVTVAGTTVKPFLVYTSAGQISAIMPSNTPVGTGTITVTYNGATSPAAPVTVAASSFGIFTLNQAGSGPGIFTSASYVVNTLTSAAQAGDATIIWGTGLGAASGGDESAGTAKLNPISAGVKVFVGGATASVIGYARSAYAGLDQIAFMVPAGVTGCHVPVAVQVGNVVSNFATMSIGAGSTTCSDPAGTGTGLTPAQLLQLQQQGTVSQGNISLSRSTSSISIPGVGSQNSTSDTGSGIFSKYTFSQFTTSTGGVNATTFGACTVFSFSGQNPTQVDPVLPITLDAGPSISITGPGGPKTLTKTSDGSYSATLGATTPGGSPLYLSAGSYTIAGTGGKDVGAFTTSLTIPAPLVWTNAASVSTVNRANGQLITWTGGDANSLTIMEGFSLVGSGNSAVGAGFYCTAKSTDQQFTIPSVVLLSMPQTGAGGILAGQIGFMGVGLATVSKQFTASGLDIGTVTDSSLTLQTVTYQ